MNKNSHSAIELHDLTVAYHRKPVLWDIDLELPQAQLIAIVGPNGAGKSTLIKAILGLVPLASGNVKIFGESLAKTRQWIGYVPQVESVDWDFPVSVMDVVLMGRYGHVGWVKRLRASDKEVALNSLIKVDMQDFAHRQISQLSGGQQQRVFLARALAQDAKLYLMDEPFAGVDAATEKAIVEVLRSLRESGKTVVVVHHDLQSVPEYFNHVVMLNQRLVAAGPVKEVFNASNLQSTYGGRLTILNEVAEAMRRNR